MIKDFAKSLTRIKEERYKNCIISKITYKVLDTNLNIQTYDVSIEKATNRISVLNSIGVCGEKNITKVTIYILHKKPLRLKEKDFVDYDYNYEYLRKYTKEEIYNYSKDIDDTNLIHLEDKPIVQGFFVLETINEYLQNASYINIKFIKPIYANDLLYIKVSKEEILGYSQNELCFKVKYYK